MNSFYLIMETIKFNKVTLGKMFIVYPNKKPEQLCLTIERPWENNEPFISCIPAGEYIMKPHISPKFGESYYLKSLINGVVGLHDGKRTHILMHSANKASQLHGCIAVGQGLGFLDGEIAIFNSKDTVSKVEELLDGFETKLIIKRY